MFNVNDEVQYTISQLEHVCTKENETEIGMAIAIIKNLFDRYVIMTTAYSDAMEKLRAATSPETEVDDYWSGPGDNRRDNYDEFEIDE